MKAKIVKLLHLFGLDVFLLGLLEKLLLELSKVVGAWKERIPLSLNQRKMRND